jgi:hypothetical protein
MLSKSEDKTQKHNRENYKDEHQEPRVNTGARER